MPRPCARPRPGLRTRLAGRGPRRLRDCDRGAASVEFVLWVPFFLGLVFLMADASILAYRYTEMWDVARSAARQLSLGALPRSQPALESFVHARLSDDYQVRLVGAYSTFWTVEIDATPTTMSVFGLFESAIDNMSARVSSGQEPMAQS